MRARCVILLGLVLSAPTFSRSVLAQGQTPEAPQIVSQAWQASNSADEQKLDTLYSQMMDNYGAKADEQAKTLTSFPARDRITDYKTMNHVAVTMFIKAEFLMTHGKTGEAKELFQQTIQRFPWAQVFDPSRGSYWSVKEKSQASLDVIEGRTPEPQQPKPKGPKTLPKFKFPGRDKVVDYSKYGHFDNVGTEKFHYSLRDRKGLAAAVGEAIYPNLTDMYKNPAYKKAKSEKRLEGSHWDFINTDDLEAAVFKWVDAPEPWGVRLFYLGTIFEKAKMYYEAIKSYQAIIVHFPNTLAMTYWQTPWYPGQAAVAKIHHIIRLHPELRLEFRGAKVRILNSFDNDPQNDVTITSPGALRQLSKAEFRKSQGEDVHRVDLGQPVARRGKGKVHLLKYKNGHWHMMVDGSPYVIRGISYSPTKVGQSPDKGTLTDWMKSDENRNGVIDGPYEAWVDQNGNNEQDSNEPTVGDFALMKQMGVNTMRMYHQPHAPDKKILRDMFDRYGIRVILGDFLGKYAIGSGASWSEGTDYSNPKHQRNMMNSVRTMVKEHKDEPYMLMWLLGNENNYGVASNADKNPEAYFKFVNQVAKMIKSIDPDHPVAVCNGDTLYLDKFAKHAPSVDIYGANLYRGDYGFGAYWEQVHEAADRPAFVTEYGAPAHGGDLMTYTEAKDAQASYHLGNWLDIEYNTAGYADGAGNSLGGVAFEWLDEWWKNYEPSLHDVKADVVGPFPGGYYYEEWFGLFGQGNGIRSPFQREPRKVFDTYQKLWNKKR